jgi:phage gp36-like protein
MSYTPEAYATAAELKIALGFQADTLLADFDEAGAVTELDRVILETSAMIDSMISGRVSVPVPTGNALLKRICITISKYDLWSRQAASNLPESLVKEYEGQMKVLERIARGEICFAADVEPSIVAGEFTSSSRAIDASLD